MIRKLQIKFVIINMTMITVMLCVIFGLVYNFTRNNLEAESISMMKTIAAEPFRRGRPNDQSPNLRLPYFTLQVGMRGELISTGGGYYDLSDQEFLKALVEHMLELARSDAEQVRQQMQPVNLSKLVMDSAISFEGLFVEHGLTMESTAQPGITVQGSEQALQQVVEILLDNAQKYSASGSETTVQLYSVGSGKCQLKVSNPGDVIPQDDLKKIFQRFYRMDKARSRDGSFGLGLSIAESIVTQHRGRI